MARGGSRGGAAAQVKMLTLASSQDVISGPLSF